MDAAPRQLAPSVPRVGAASGRRRMDAALRPLVLPRVWVNRRVAVIAAARRHRHGRWVVVARPSAGPPARVFSVFGRSVVKWLVGVPPLICTIGS